MTPHRRKTTLDFSIVHGNFEYCLICIRSCSARHQEVEASINDEASGTFL